MRLEYLAIYKHRWSHLLNLLHKPPFGNDVKPFVAKLVKSFGRLGDAAESLDDFRYKKV